MSCRHNALSNGIEAFISRMMAEGPAANLPPHIWLEAELSLISRSLPLFAALLMLGGCDSGPKPDAQPSSADLSGASAPADGEAGKIDRSHAGQAMPQATFSDPAGAKLNLASLKGKPVLINLWATWCAPCVKELPTLDALAAKGVNVVTVSQDTGEPAKVAAALHYAHLHPWLDPDNTLGFYYNSGVLPTSVLYDAQGREVWRMVGGHDWSGETAGGLAGVK